MKKSIHVLAITALAFFLTACGDKNQATTAASAPAPAPVTAPVVATAPAAENALGKSVFGKVCSMCHAVGAAGSPKPGDKADWGPRIA